jgi:endonuclease/exonuclease/phosphatase (EEP) superfamily protein YafD
VRALAGVYVLIAVAAFAAQWISALSVFQAPALQLGVLGVALAAPLAWGRRFKAAALTIAASAVFWITVAPFLLPADAERIAGEPTIRLTLLETSNAKAIEYVLQTRPDLVVMADLASAQHDRTADLAAAYPTRIESGELLILARRAVVLHRTPVDSELKLLRVQISMGQQSFDLAVVHLERPWPLGAASHREPSAAAKLAKRLAGETGRLILVGDFNRPPWMSDMQALRGWLGVAAEAAPGTWPDWMPRPLRLPLDLVLVGKDLVLRGMKLGPNVGSDHLPIEAEIALLP